MSAHHATGWVSAVTGVAFSLLLSINAHAGPIDLVGQLAPQGTDDYY